MGRCEGVGRKRRYIARSSLGLWEGYCPKFDIGESVLYDNREKVTTLNLVYDVKNRSHEYRVVVCGGEFDGKVWWVKEEELCAF